MVNTRSSAAIAGHPLHPMLVPIPIACFVGTLFSDIAYAVTDEPQWADLSSWLLSVGLVVAMVAVIAGLLDFLWEPNIHSFPNSWIHAIGNAVALLLSVWNALVHSHDGSIGVAAVVLSASVVIILAVTGWNGCSLVHRHGVGRKNAL